MAIATGTTLGRYEVRNLIGTGGMGEVYLAQDTQLRRLVALKILPAHFTLDEDRLRRFEQEAYSASALNHPNILTIYEIGQFDSTRFMAMEYVEGETLREHIHGSNKSFSGETQLTGAGLKLNEALDLAIQIASALAASQAAGIAHRDIKPENIMLRRDGYVKLLDFGLAKLTERPETTDNEAPTRALVNTSPGAVMGTVNYMSPEQARAHTVDSRTDIWSLGIVLYEMITSRVPFEGPTPSHVIVAILEKDPPPLARYLNDVPEALEWIVTKALTKDRDDRYQTAREMLTDLRRLKQRIEVGAEMERSIAPDGGNPHITYGGGGGVSTMSGFAGGQTTTQLGTAPTISSAEYLVQGIGRHKVAVGLAVFLLVASVVAIAVLWAKLKPTPNTFRQIALTQLTNTGKANLATISPDGKYVVHVVNDGAQSSLWVRQVATTSDVQIVPTSEARYIGLTFSKDGNYIFYVVYEKNSPLGIVYQIPVLGGNPRKMAQDVDTPITFSPDGKRFAWIRNFPQAGETALFVANIDGTNEQKVASRQRPLRFTAGAAIGPSWSPENNVVACPVAGPEDGADRHRLMLVEVDSKTEKDASPQRWSFVQQLVWTPHNTGLLVAAQEQQGGPNQLWYVNQPGGEVSRITNDLNNYNGMSISADGSTLATVQSQANSSVWVAPNSNADAAIKITSGTNEGGNGLALMPDGRIIYSVFGGGRSDLFIVNPDGSNRQQLTSNAGLNALPYPSQDGRYIAFVSTRTGAPHVWRMDSDGSNPKQITNGVAEVSPIITPDSQWIIYQNIYDLRLWKIPIDGGAPVQVMDKLASQHAISPDGKLLACRYREQDLSPFVLGLIDLATGKTVKTIDIPPTNPTLDWSADGRAVLFSDTRGGVSNVWSQDIDGGAPRQITNFKSDLIFVFDLSTDGKRMAFGRGTVSNNVVLISNVK